MGAITSAAWGYWNGKNLAMAYVDPNRAGLGTELEVMLIRKLVEATVCPLSPDDPKNEIPRGVA